jgi:hypothetical protein
MPKITRGGVSNQFVDPDFISEPGVPVEKAMDEGLPDVGQEGVHIGDEPGHDRHKPDGQDVDRERQAVDEQPKGNDDHENGRDLLRPSNEFPAHDSPRKTPAKKAAPAAKK